MQQAMPLTVADLDEWIADVERDAPNTTHTPNDWARSGLGALLGEDVPYQLWTTAELLALLRRARQAAEGWTSTPAGYLVPNDLDDDPGLWTGES